MKYNQGDIIQIDTYKKQLFVIVSKNAFIRATGIFHVCPILQNVLPGPVHIAINGKDKTKGTVICEQIKAIDPELRNCRRMDYLSYEDIMDISDVIQGLFEYD